MIGHVIAGQRGKVFLVSKVSPDHATASGIRQACAASLARLGTEYLDLYLLHWRGGVSDLSVVVDNFESLRAEGRIRRWGVSNFLVGDMEDLYRVRGGDGCATNQVRYNLKDRSIERNLLPWCEQHGLPIMAYSPLDMGGDLLRNTALIRIAERHQSSPAVIALAWTIRRAHHLDPGIWLAGSCAAECLCIVAAVDGSGFGRIEPGVRNVELGANVLAPAPDTVTLCVHTADGVPQQAISLPGGFVKGGVFLPHCDRSAQGSSSPVRVNSAVPSWSCQRPLSAGPARPTSVRNRRSTAVTRAIDERVKIAALRTFADGRETG